MSLIQCKECGKRISKKSEVCPYCGEPVPKQKTQSGWKTILYIVGIFYGITFILWVTKSGFYSEESRINRQVETNVKEVHKPQKERRITLKGGYFACTTEALFDEIITAAVNKDNLAIGHLMSKGCVLTKKGVRISIIDLGIFSGITKIRAYGGNNSIVMYTNTENVYY